MKLSEPFGLLWSKVEEMGATRAEVNLGEVWDHKELEFDIELSRSGVEVSLEDLESKQGLLSVRGRQVVLFIPDHSFRVETALKDPSQGNKYHVADCDTLDRMRRKKRFERYKVTNNLSGEFEVFGTAKHGNQVIEGVATLDVCKNCLMMLNYKGAKNCTPPQRSVLTENFSVADFFITYSSVFKTLPKQLISQASRGYSDDWKEVSATCRQAANYTCQNCSVDLSSNRSLVHAHHKNGQKSDNADSNLMALCADCHRKEPFHGHLFVKHKDVQSINRLRREQGLLDSDDWSAVYVHADPAVHGVLNHCQRRRMQPPVVGYEITNAQGEIIDELELGWPQLSQGVYLGDEKAVTGWRLFGLQQAVEFFGQ